MYSDIHVPDKHMLTGLRRYQDDHNVCTSCHHQINLTFCFPFPTHNTFHCIKYFISSAFSYLNTCNVFISLPPLPPHYPQLSLSLCVCLLLLPCMLKMASNVYFSGCILSLPRVLVVLQGAFFTRVLLVLLRVLFLHVC